MGFPGVNKMKKIILSLSLVVPAYAQQGIVPAPTTSAPASAPVAAAAPSGGEASRIYIPVGDPNVKRVLLAIEPTRGSGGAVASFFETLTSDMDFTDLFEILPASKIPSERGGMVSGTFGMDPFKAVGAEFLIKSAITLANGRLQAEVRLYDVARNVQILGRLYPLVGSVENPGRELAHYAGNDIVQALTGEKGIFRTRILMQCGMKTKEIYIMDFDGKNVRKLTGDGNFALSPAWAPDGRRILFTSYRPAIKGGPLNPNLYMYDLVSKQRSLVSAAQGLNSGAAFHPREEKIAFTFSRNGKPEIYIQDLVKKMRFPITKTVFFSVEPSWAPSGTELVFSSSKTGRPHIWVANQDGSNARRLTFAGVYNSSPDWSPRGDKIVFSGQENMRNNFNIFMIDPSGSNLVRLTADSYSSENPSFSPDGRYLTFASNQSGKYQIQVMTARGTRVRPLSPPSLGHCKDPAWSPRL
jgi:TolB protein